MRSCHPRCILGPSLDHPGYILEPGRDHPGYLEYRCIDKNIDPLPFPDEHPEWASPPYPDRPPTRLARVLIRVTEWLRKW